jgi:N-formylglutamate deformylase
MTQSFHLAQPEKHTTSVVFTSPHSGREYPTDFLENSHLGSISIRNSEDAFVDDLYADVVKFGAPLLSALFPRAYVDLNRSGNELDPAMIIGASPSPLNPRIASGLGVIPRVVSEGRAIQFGKITMKEAQERLDQCYYPFHARLQELLENTRQNFGQAILLDCHSMPSDALKSCGLVGGKRANVVLGNRFGATCSDTVLDKVEDAFSKQGFIVSRNLPFAGAYIVQTYGRPSISQHAIQIEIDRSLYMDEEAIVRLPDFQDIKLRLTNAAKDICDFGQLNTQLAAQ